MYSSSHRAVAINISAMNTRMNTGGPFGTSIYERDLSSGTTRLLAVGCNRVVPLGNSTSHGEITAIQFAEKKLNRFSLGPTETHEYILCTSCEPCVMCLGAVLWSGCSRMICSATKDDAESIGFNEGPVFPESYKALEQAGIMVTFRVSQPEAMAVLKKYGEEGVIY
jgi:tRNA(Arg) A34 adenosine deaminase TadA